MKNLSRLASKATQNYEEELIKIFEELKLFDPVVTDAALSLFENNLSLAAKFMNKRKSELSQKTPIEAIEEGKSEEVLALIGRLEHGVF